MMTRRLLMTLCASLMISATLKAAPEPVPEKTKGEMVGTIIKKERGKITLEGQERHLTLMPYWRGGMPKDGGGFDKDMLQKLEAFKVGDRVRVTWTFQEHYRIDTIERIQKPE